MDTWGAACWRRNKCGARVLGQEDSRKLKELREGRQERAGDWGCTAVVWPFKVGRTPAVLVLKGEPQGRGRGRAGREMAGLRGALLAALSPGSIAVRHPVHPRPHRSLPFSRRPVGAADASLGSPRASDPLSNHSIPGPGAEPAAPGDSGRRQARLTGARSREMMPENRV